MNRYEVFIKVVELGSFTKAAAELSYTQSAVSQMVKTLETELNTTLVVRSREGVALTPDGIEYLPYLRAVCTVHEQLRKKKSDMLHFTDSVIKIGTMPGTSRNWLPTLMKDFKQIYPGVHFELVQGEYTNICQWIKSGRVDFGFLSVDSVDLLDYIPLRSDEMMCILPPDHPLCLKEKVFLYDIAHEPYILLDEGNASVLLKAFESLGLKPDIQYKVYDDRTIKAMVEQGMGVSILYSLVLHKRTGIYAIRPIDPPVIRTIAVAFKDKKALSAACRRFIDFTVDSLKDEM